MYQFSYAEVVEESPRELRAREQRAVEEAIRRLQIAQEAGPKTREMTDALYFVRNLWDAFMEDLRNPSNELPEPMRAGLISIGIWMLKEIEGIRRGDVADLSSIVEINGMIKNGLA
jgi:flagellar biosynthesis activator protein FlaF